MKKQKNISTIIDSSLFFENFEDNSTPNNVAPSPKENDSKGRKPNSEDDIDISLYCDYDDLLKDYRKETHLHFNQVELNSEVSFVEYSKTWEGTVLDIYEKTFAARLDDKEGKRKSRIVEMKKNLINRQDWEVFFNKGFEFEWLFQRVNNNGTVRNRNQIRFTPIAHLMPNEIDERVEREMVLFSYLFEKDD